MYGTEMAITFRFFFFSFKSFSTCPNNVNIYTWIRQETGQLVSPRVLSLIEEKTHSIWKQNLNFPKRGTKKNVSVIALRIAMTLDVKILQFCHQVALCVKKQHKNAIFGCSWFQKFNFVCLLLRPMICSSKTVSI